VIIPLRTGGEHLGTQLEALASQTYGDRWEVVIVDNGCADDALAVIDDWRDRLPALRIVDATDRAGLNYARNAGTRVARGDFLAFCDADDIVTAGWLDALAEAAHSADIVGGMAELDSLNGDKVVRSRTGSPPGGLRLQHGFLRSVSGGNCGMWASVAHALRWDEAFSYASSDIEFSWRAELAAYRLAVAPKALIRKRQRLGAKALARQWYLYGESDAQLFRHFRDRGMPRSSVVAALREWAWLLSRLYYLASSASRRRRWLTLVARRMGRLTGSLRHRVWFP
jgi:glycosyltransferase involved in cell wall biosynthesis